MGALGQFSGKKSTQSLYDNRLFNQESGLQAGFGANDDNNLYDRPLFESKSRKMYRPTNMDSDIYGGIDDGDDILNEQKDDALTKELKRYSSNSSKKGKDVGQHSKGFMYAAGGGSVRNAEDYVPGKREKVGFVEADKEENAEKDVKVGLHYTENAKRAKKEKERRDKEKWHQYDNDRRRRRRSR